MAFLREPYPEDITHRIAHDFSPDDRPTAAKILNDVRDLGWHVPWVQLAALRAAGGKLAHLQQWVDLGNKDPRDLQLALESLAGPGWEREFILYGLRGGSAGSGGHDEYPSAAVDSPVGPAQIGNIGNCDR